MGVLGGLETTDIFTKTTKFTQIRDIKYIFLDFNNLLWQKNPLLLGPAAVRHWIIQPKNTRFLGGAIRRSDLTRKVAVLSKWSFVKWRFSKCKPVDYSNAAVYTCKLVDYSKVAVYKCKLAVYTCKVLNYRFTTFLLITLLDTVEVTPFFQFFFVKQWFTGVNCCFTINHHFTSCKLPLYCKPWLYKL